jgi:hypothetical protein
MKNSFKLSIYYLYNIIIILIISSNLFLKGISSSMNKQPIFSKLFPSVSKLSITNSKQQQKQTPLISSTIISSKVNIANNEFKKRETVDRSHFNR